MFGISVWQLLIILLVVVLLFGTKKLRNMGSDVGGAVKGFKDAVKDGENQASSKNLPKQDESQADIIEGQASTQEKKDEA